MGSLVRLCLPGARDALLLLLLLPLPFVGPVALSAQYVAGVVLEQGSGAVVGDAIVTLYRADDDGGLLEPAGTTVTDENGAFAFRAVGSGSFVVRADHGGLSSPLSSVLAVEPGPGVVDLVLVIPSRLLMMASSCDLETEPGAIVAGSVRDGTSDVPLPGARVDVRWRGERGYEVKSVDADAGGRYVLCGVPAGGPLDFRAGSLGRTGPWREVALERPALVLHDITLDVEFSSATGRGLLTQTYTQQSVGAIGDLRGQLLDQNSGLPIQGAVVRMQGTQLQALADGEGRFTFEQIPPDRYVLEIHHLGYRVETSEVEVPEGQDVSVRLRLSPRAVALEAIDVRARTAEAEVVRTSPFRRAVLAGETLAREEARGAGFTDVLRRHMLGLRVREHYTENGTRLCLETNRRIQRIAQDRSELEIECAMVQVVLDGVRLTDDEWAPVADFIRGISIAEIESMEYMTPVQAATLFGVGANVSNGALVIYTRGKGPYRSGARSPG